MTNASENPQHTIEETGWSMPVRILFFVIWLGIAMGLVLLARPLWWLLVLILIIGYLVQPFVGLLTRIYFPRGLATIVTLLAVLLLVLVVPSILVPLVFQDIAPISIDWNGLLQGAVQWTQQLPNTLPGFEVFGYRIDLTPFYDQFAAELLTLQPQIIQPSVDNIINTLIASVRPTVQVVGFATTLATNVIGRTISIVLYVLLFVLLSYYFTYDQPRIVNYLIQLAPDRYEAEWRELWRRTGRTWGSFFRGQLVLSIVVGMAVWLGLSILGVPGALALGVLAGILEIIPNLGPLLAEIPAILMALLQGSTVFPDVSNWLIALIVFGFYLLVQQVENYFLVPRILGRSVGIHPALVLLGVIVFTIQFGILGAFVATPVLATILIWFHYFHARILGQHPYPELVLAQMAQTSSETTSLTLPPTPGAQPAVVTPPEADGVDEEPVLLAADGQMSPTD